MPDGTPTLPRGGLVLTGEPEILAGRRAFPKAQELFGGSPVADELSVAVGWHDTSVHEEVGSFALVNYSAGLDDLLGEIVRVSYDTRQVFAYVLQDADLPAATQLSLTRRTFMAVARPSLEVVGAAVVVVA